MLEPFDNEYNEVLNMLKSINKEIKKNLIHRNVGLSNFVDISTEIYHLSTIIILWWIGNCLWEKYNIFMFGNFVSPNSEVEHNMA